MRFEWTFCKDFKCEMDWYEGGGVNGGLRIVFANVCLGVPGSDSQWNGIELEEDPP